jgi:hypothetical protein
MLIGQALLVLFALSIVAVATLVAGRLARCTFRALRARRYGLVALSILGVACVAVSVVAVAAVWFGYGVSHSKKDLWTDLRIVLLTGIPFWLISFALWRMGGRFDARLQAPAPERRAD